MTPDAFILFDRWLYHPYWGKGYQFWSGIGGRSLGAATALAVVSGFWKHHNCHHKGCWRPGHRHPVYGWPACKVHWKERPDHA